MADNNQLKIFTDGGSRGNPGPAAIGVYIVNTDGKEIVKLAEQIGVTTNNVAEYSAVILALNWLKKNLDEDKISENRFAFFLDSSLVVNQLTGNFKVKDFELKNLVIKIKNLEKQIDGEISYHHIPREENKVADFLVNSSF